MEAAHGSTATALRAEAAALASQAEALRGEVAALEAAVAEAEAANAGLRAGLSGEADAAQKAMEKQKAKFVRHASFSFFSLFLHS